MAKADASNLAHERGFGKLRILIIILYYQQLMSYFNSCSRWYKEWEGQLCKPWIS